MIRFVGLILLAIIFQRLYHHYMSVTLLPFRPPPNPRDDLCTIYILETANLSAIDDCLMDKQYQRPTKHVQSSEFNVSALIEPGWHYSRFFVYDRDYFTMYLAHDGSSTKFRYRSRNTVFALLWRNMYSKKSLLEHGFLKDQEGVWTMEQPPVHYFVYRPDELHWEDPNYRWRQESECLLANVNLADDNSIVSYYKTPKELDEFARAVRSKGEDRCNQELFVINHDDMMQVVSVDDPQIRFEFKAKDRYKYLPGLMDRSLRIEELTAIDDREKFGLHNYDGEMLTEESLFIIRVMTERRQQEGGGFYEIGDMDDVDEEEIWFFTESLDWLNIHKEEPDGHSTFDRFFANPQTPVGFRLKMVRSILYLVTNNMYVGVGVLGDSQMLGLYLSSDVPKKENRLRINVEEEYFTFSMWGNKEMCGWVSWVKNGYGGIDFHVPGEEGYYSRDMLKMRAYKID